MRAAVVLVLCKVPTDLPQIARGAQPAAETYESATIDADGHLVIVKTGGQMS